MRFVIAVKNRRGETEYITCQGLLVTPIKNFATIFDNHELAEACVARIAWTGVTLTYEIEETP